MKTYYYQKGFTLLELMVTIAIVGILISLAAPNFSDALARGAVRDVASEWQETFYFAQSEAMRLQNNVLLCASNDGESCTGGNFDNGWIVLDQGSGTVLRDTPPPSSEGLSIVSSSGRSTYTFNGAGRLTGFVGDTLNFSLTRGSEKLYDRTLTLNTEGRIR